jgi:hypothetical protein
MNESRIIADHVLSETIKFGALATLPYEADGIESGRPTQFDPLFFDQSQAGVQLNPCFRGDFSMPPDKPQRSEYPEMEIPEPGVSPLMRNDAIGETSLAPRRHRGP